MRYISMERAKANMVLAKPIFDSSGRVLLEVNTILSDEYIEKLNERGLSGIYIEDKLSKGIEIKETITLELRNKGVEAIRDGDFDLAFEVAKSIVDEIMSESSVSLEMMDLRTFDDYTYRHSVNVAVISTIIGINLELNRINLEQLCIAALLHDIGKAEVPADILNKPGKLDDDEYAEVQKHSTYAYEIVKQRIDLNTNIKMAILSHHENEDGTGYPQGLTKDKISMYAKIIHVADVFDALTSKRPYKQPYSRIEAVEYLMGSCGRLFNRRVVVAFLKSVSVFPVGTTVLLSDGREAIVVRNTKNVLRPVIRFMDGKEIDLGDLSLNRNITIIKDEFQMAV